MSKDTLNTVELAVSVMHDVARKADVDAFICSESRVYGVVPGNGSQQNAMHGS